VWNFLCDECDEAGMWPVDVDALEFFVGAPVDLKLFIETINNDRTEVGRIEFYGEKNEKLWIPGFCEFHNGPLSPDCIPHKKIILLLEKYGLIDRVPVRVQDRVSHTHKERRGQGKDVAINSDDCIDSTEEKKKNENQIDIPEKPANSRQKPPNRPRLKITGNEDNVSKKDYDVILELLERTIDVAEQKRILADFIYNKLPNYIDPFCDIWNLSVMSYEGVSQVKEITETRLRKFRVRIKEPAFDFVKILTEIKLSPHLRGENSRGWKVTFDWILENDQNYIKILEGNYRG
jgi:hypothetical protein